MRVLCTRELTLIHLLITYIVNTLIKKSPPHYEITTYIGSRLGEGPSACRWGMSGRQAANSPTGAAKEGRLGVGALGGAGREDSFDFS